MNKRTFIIDDEAPARIILKQYVEEFPEIEIIGECKNGAEAVAAIDKEEPDLIFLDIQMPLLNGFQVIQKIIHIPQIIFTTAYDKFALNAFNVNAIDYLLKPYTFERFEQAVTKVIHNHKPEKEKLEQLTTQLQQNKEYPERLLVETQGGRLIGLQSADIIHIEASGDYAKIITFSSQHYLTSTRMALLEQRLNPNMFTRIHRSDIININAVKEVSKDGNGGYDILLTNHHVVRASRTYAANVRKFML
jgi:two-component system, LytTR family, response regulator